MSHTPKSIKQAFGYRLQVNSPTKYIICRTVLKLPSDTIDFVTENCWFVGSMDEALAFTLSTQDIKKGEYIIFLSDELLSESESQIAYTIMHEIGHAVLGHKNAILERQTKAQIKKQEKEADDFAKQVLSV